MEDQRIFERLAMKLPLRFLDLYQGKEGFGEINDFSAKGLGAVVMHELQPRAPVEVWINIPEQQEPIYTRGEVAWSTPHDNGTYKVGINLEKANLMNLSRACRLKKERRAYAGL